MKLRISGRSVRFRVLRSEVAALIATGRIEETVHLAGEDGLTYSLALEPRSPEIGLRYHSSHIAVLLPHDQATTWAETDQVGMYGTVSVGAHGDVDLIVEKDYSCLDLSDANNRDTFPNPLSKSAGAGEMC